MVLQVITSSSRNWPWKTRPGNQWVAEQTFHEPLPFRSSTAMPFSVSQVRLQFMRVLQPALNVIPAFMSQKWTHATRRLTKRSKILVEKTTLHACRVTRLASGCRLASRQTTHRTLLVCNARAAMDPLPLTQQIQLTSL